MARRPEIKKKASRITVPKRCNPAVKIVFAEMARQGVTYDELEFRSGVLKSTFKAWRTNNRPGLETMEAALGALGWAFLPVPTVSQLPPLIGEKLEALASEWGDTNPLLCELLARVCRVKITSALERKAKDAGTLKQLSDERALREQLQEFSERRLASAMETAETTRKALEAELTEAKKELRARTVDLEHYKPTVKPELEAKVRKLTSDLSRRPTAFSWGHREQRKSHARV